MEKDVWNRVQAGRESAGGLGLKALAARSQGLLAAYRSMKGPVAEELARQERQTLGALQGLGALTGTPVPQGPVPGPKVRELLKWCWRENLELLAEYTARSAQPGVGVVFRRLSAAAEAQAERIAQAAGPQGGRPIRD